jgi:hypothetical protein
MQVVVSADPIGGTLYTNRETGKSATLLQAGEWFVFQDPFSDCCHCRCVGSWSKRRDAIEQLERILA